MKHTRIKIIYPLLGLFILVGFWVLFQQSASLRQSLSALRQADVKWVVFGFLAAIGTFISASFTLKTLALKKLSYKNTLIVQLASGAATKVVPSGIGGLVLNIRYLQRQQHSLVQAASVMMVNNGLGFLGHILIISNVFFLSLSSPIIFSVKLPVWTILAAVCFIFLLVIGAVMVKSLRQKIHKTTKEIKRAFTWYRHRPYKLLAGLFGASSVTFLFAMCLWCSAQAMSVDLTLIEVLIVLSVGLFGIAITPTPGGIGGAEAAITGALMTLGETFTIALSVALIYRLLTYWTPVIPGIFAVQYSLRRKII
ncbi:MAG: flippase-like domain-containing protein [bacterium]|nr:flippase-like domain-containing protein [bacterium]